MLAAFHSAVQSSNYLKTESNEFLIIHKLCCLPIGTGRLNLPIGTGRLNLPIEAGRLDLPETCVFEKRML